eukprot:2099445-Pleurochrysis_carterae.AAC.1
MKGHTYTLLDESFSILIVGLKKKPSTPSAKCRSSPGAYSHRLRIVMPARSFICTDNSVVGALHKHK